jgi:hypothetical protein
MLHTVCYRKGNVPRAALSGSAVTHSNVMKLKLSHAQQKLFGSSASTDAKALRPSFLLEQLAQLQPGAAGAQCGRDSWWAKGT